MTKSLLRETFIRHVENMDYGAPLGLTSYMSIIVINCEMFLNDTRERLE